MTWGRRWKSAPVSAAPAEKPPRSRFKSKWEEKYDGLLAYRQAQGEIQDFGYERVALRLPGDVMYRPDFDVWRAAGVIELHEVKGRMREPARIKLRQAIELYPGFHWYIVGADMQPRRMMRPSDVPSTTR